MRKKNEKRKRRRNQTATIKIFSFSFFIKKYFLFEKIFLENEKPKFFHYIFITVFFAL